MLHDGCQVVVRSGARRSVVEAVVGLGVVLWRWRSSIAGVSSSCHLRCSRPVRRSCSSHRSILQPTVRPLLQFDSNVVKRGKRMSLSSSYQAGGACRHVVKQTNVVLTVAAQFKPPKVQVTLLVVFTYLQTVTRDHIQIVGCVVKQSFVVLNAYANALYEPLSCFFADVFGEI